MPPTSLPTPPGAHQPALRPAPHRSPPHSFEPVPFRARPCPPPGTEISRPVPLRSRTTSFCATGVCPGCSGTTPGACRSATVWSLADIRSPQPNRVVSFGSAVTPHSQSAASTDGDDAPRSWDWPSDDDTLHRPHATTTSRGSRSDRRRAMRIRPSSRSDSSSSDADCAAATKVERTEWATRGSRYRPTNAQRSQSALVEPSCCAATATPRADGPRPWDMTEAQPKNFASFGFRKNVDRGVSFGDTLSSKHLSKNGAVKGDDPQKGANRVLKFLKRLSVPGLKRSSATASGHCGNGT